MVEISRHTSVYSIQDPSYRYRCVYYGVGRRASLGMRRAGRKSSSRARREIATAAAISRPLRREWAGARSTRGNLTRVVEARGEGAAA